MERLNGIRSHITNGSSLGDVSQKDICAIIGVSPSTSARSPKVWNYAFDKLGGKSPILIWIILLGGGVLAFLLFLLHLYIKNIAIILWN